MRKAITAGFDCNVNDSFGDVLGELTKALKRFDIEIFVTPNSDDATFAISLYKFLDKADVTSAIKTPQFDETHLEEVFLEYLVDNIGKNE
jgi:predicted CopG family antitoxin